MIAGRGKLDSDKAREFFAKHGVRLTLTTTNNPEANEKIKRGHSPIIKALAKACDGRVKIWPQMLPYALWVDRTTHSSVTGYMPVEVMSVGTDNANGNRDRDMDSANVERGDEPGRTISGSDTVEKQAQQRYVMLIEK